MARRKPTATSACEPAPGRPATIDSFDASIMMGGNEDKNSADPSCPNSKLLG